MLRPTLALAALLLLGCAPRTRLSDTKTIHDAAASRIWILQDDGVDQHVVLCDVAMLQAAHTLCMRATITQAPAGAPMFAPAPPPAAR